MPGTTSFTFDNDFFTSTQLTYLDRLNDTINIPYPVSEDALSVGLQTQEGGHTVIVKYETADHSTPTRLQTGYESFDNFAQPTLTPGNDTWALIAQPVFISKKDRWINRGKAQQAKLVEVRTKNVRNHIHRVLMEVILQGAASSGSWAGHAAYADFNTLNGADNSGGLIEATATGTNTVHGLAKASYPPATNPNLHNLFYDAAGSFASNGLNGAAQLQIKLIERNGAMDPGKYRSYASLNLGEFFKRALRASEQYMSQDKLDDGRLVMTYGGMPITFTSKLPDDGATSASNKWSWLWVPWGDGISFVGMKDAVMATEPFETVPLTGVQASAFYLMGQLMGEMAGNAALMVDAESW